MNSRSRSIERTLVLLISLAPLGALAQPRALLIDRVIAVVGREAILHSELIMKTEQARQSDPTAGAEHSCAQLEDLLSEKLALEQAKLDSVTVDEGQVSAELERRIRYFAAQLGGDQKLEQF